jgi:hypothetical protein
MGRDGNRNIPASTRPSSDISENPKSPERLRQFGGTSTSVRLAVV